MKLSETACPFCGTSAVTADRTPRPDSSGIRDRSTLLFGAAAVASALAVAGCGNSTNSGGGNGVVMPYGAPQIFEPVEAGGPPNVMPQAADAGPQMGPSAPGYGLAVPPPGSMPTSAPIAAPSSSTAPPKKK
jgi:hypothetical protein